MIPERIRAVFLRRDVGRALRAALTPDHVALVLAPGALPPELGAGCSWASVEGVRVAGAPLARAVELARARSEAAAVQLASDPPARAAWCLYLEAGTGLAVVPFLTSRPSREAA